MMLAQLNRLGDLRLFDSSVCQPGTNTSDNGTRHRAREWWDSDPLGQGCRPLQHFPIDKQRDSRHGNKSSHHAANPKGISIRVPGAGRS